MKKLLLPLAALLLSVTASAQLPEFPTFDTPRGALRSDGGVPSTLPTQPQPKAAEGPQHRLAQNQIYAGNNMGDIPNVGIGVGTVVTGEVKAGTLVRSSILADYAGYRIVGARFALLAAVGESTVEIQPLTSKGYGADILAKTVEVTQQGWNEVMFDSTYTLTGNENLMLMYSYNQVSGQVAEAFPVAASGSYVSAGLLFYANLGSNGLGWYMLSASYGNLMMQLILERDEPFEPYDLAIDEVNVAKYAKCDGQSTTPLNITLHNAGNQTVTNADLDILLDGERIGAINITDEDNYNITTSKKNLSATMRLASIPSGEHTLGVRVAKVMGAAPAGNTADDELSSSFKSYKESKPHQKQLVEQFTGTSCVYCPEGYNTLNALAAMRSDLAWVAIHDGYEPDEYTLYAGTDSTQTLTDPLLQLLDVRENPDGAFNRYYSEDTWLNSYNAIVIGIGFPEGSEEYGAQQLSNMLDESNSNWPAFADMNIATHFDAATRTLDVTVSGEGTEDVKAFMENVNLTVYLAEDSLRGRQYSYDYGWIEDYEHNGVVRSILTDVLGDPVAWDGNKYSVSFTTKVSEAWNADNMNVVAFLTPTEVLDERSAAVFQCEKVKLGSSVTAIAAPTATPADVTVVARYNAAGQQIGAPARGLNIVRMSDGTVRKVLVK